MQIFCETHSSTTSDHRECISAGPCCHMSSSSSSSLLGKNEWRERIVREAAYVVPCVVESLQRINTIFYCTDLHVHRFDASFYLPWYLSLSLILSRYTFPTL